MPSRVIDRLGAARRHRFVGREGERALFRSGLAGGERPWQVLFVFGPGGIGKTSLLREFVGMAEESGQPAFYLDGRNVEPTPDSFLGALQASLGLAADAVIPCLAAPGEPRIILMDTYEALEPLDSWLRETLLPQLDQNCRVVMAGRTPPSPAWRSDAGWQDLIRFLPLRNLSPSESRSYLSKCQVPPAEHDAVLRFTHGHPLALSLVADAFAQRPGLHFQPDDAPDVIRTLLERFVQKVPGPAHRAALEATSLVRVTTESLLGAMLRQSDVSEGTSEPASSEGVHGLFTWLRGLSFVESNRDGLFPHDLAREALVADLRWRNPDWYRELHHRARDYFSSRIQSTHGLEQQRVLFDYVFLHRDNPVIRSMLEWQSGTLIVPDSLREADRRAVVEMVEKHEGIESAQLADLWLTSQPEGVTVYRDEGGELVGFIAMVSLERATPEELEADPAARLAWEYLKRRAPLRPGEIATHYRFWMARDTYQNVSPVQTLIFLNTVRHQLTAPGLAFHFLPCADPDLWAGAFAYANLTRLTEIDYSIGRSFGVYGHDWRAQPPLAWLQMLAEREVAGGQASAPVPAPPPILVLSKEEFTAAVRDALRDFPRVESLASSPLIQSRVVTQTAGASATPSDRAASLQMLLKQVAESLQATPRQSKLYRALDQTYLHPARSQEQAAENLDLPFSTFRRHLKEGIDQVVESLWQQEIGRQ